MTPRDRGPRRAPWPARAASRGLLALTKPRVVAHGADHDARRLLPRRRGRARSAPRCIHHAPRHGARRRRHAGAQPVPASATSTRLMAAHAAAPAARGAPARPLEALAFGGALLLLGLGCALAARRSTSCPPWSRPRPRVHYLLVYTPLKPRTVALLARRAPCPARCRRSPAGPPRATTRPRAPGCSSASCSSGRSRTRSRSRRLYRDDYARAGIRVLPVVDREGASTERAGRRATASRSSRWPAADADRPRGPRVLRRRARARARLPRSASGSRRWHRRATRAACCSPRCSTCRCCSACWRSTRYEPGCRGRRRPPGPQPPCGRDPPRDRGVLALGGLLAGIRW